jgi:Proton-conducting membrane transporter
MHACLLALVNCMQGFYPVLGWLGKLHALPYRAIRGVNLAFKAPYSGQCSFVVSMPMDAMEGPTPVSALIHAATLVTAGVYLMVRLHVHHENFIILVGSLTGTFWGGRGGGVEIQRHPASLPARPSTTSTAATSSSI